MFDGGAARRENRQVGASLRPVVVCVALTLALASVLAPRPLTAQSPQLHDRLYREAIEALRGGKLLVAARRLPDPNFARTVVLLADAGPKGAMGLVINRRSEVTIARLFPHLKPSLTTADHAFVGGPVEQTHALALVRGAEAPIGARPVAQGVFLVTASEAIETLIARGAAASRFRVYVGYAGWGPGQLEAEIAEGSWHVIDGDSELVFTADPAALWQRQIARTEVIQARRLEPERPTGAGG
jgi:putative transcriptional regulator